MKIFLLLALMCSTSCLAQIKTIDVPTPQAKEQKYDSLQNLNLRNAMSHKGQVLYIVGNNDSKSQGYYWNKFFVNPDLRAKPYKSVGKYSSGTDYEAVTGKYYKVIDVIKDGEMRVWLHLEPDNIREKWDRCYYLVETARSIDNVPHITLGYYYKMKSLMIDNIFITREEKLTSATTGETIIVPIRTQFKCIDIGIDDEKKEIVAIFENNKYGKVRAYFFDGNKPKVTCFTDLKRYNYLVRKFGRTWANSISETRLKIGMTKEMAIEAWGKPYEINRTTGSFGTDEQWVYEGYYVYFRNGKLYAIQNF